MIELAVASLRMTGALRLRVTGSSMLPAIRPGDVLAVTRCELGQARPGDVILFRRADRLFAHRVVGRGDTDLVTRGDAVATADAPVEAREMLGKVASIERHGLTLAPTGPNVLQRAAAWVFRRSPLAGRLFTRWSSRGLGTP